jgi:phosphate transport system substrate-binding protein
VPVTAGPVCLVYNLTGLDGPLKLSAETVAGIYGGAIINWQDPAIAKDNPGGKLPKAAIMVVHRSDGSGTTNIFTTYLSAVSESWSGKAGHGLSVEWPAGIAAAGSTGVIDIVKLTPGTIGYLELNYAKQQHMPVASIRNRAGTYVEPTPASASETADAFKDKLATDVRAAIVDPPATAKTAYPIVGFTFVLIPKERARRDEQVAVRDFLRFTLSQGQDASESLHYAKLPAVVLQHASESLGQLTAAGQSLN